MQWLCGGFVQQNLMCRFFQKTHSKFCKQIALAVRLFNITTNYRTKYGAGTLFVEFRRREPLFTRRASEVQRSADIIYIIADKSFCPIINIPLNRVIL